VELPCLNKISVYSAMPQVYLVSLEGMAIKKPVGAITRGTTNPNRLRRVDRFIANLPQLKASNPIVVDLGFGATPTTSIEMLQRLAQTNPQVTVIGIEIDRERVERGIPFQTKNLLFGLGGFEIPLPKPHSDKQVDVIRAMNVLRQYDESEVLSSWELMQSRLTNGGCIVEGTSDELGRIASWVTLSKTKVVSFTVALKLNEVERPSKVAERLPKILIHKNVEGEAIHRLLRELDDAWFRNSGLSTFSPAQRWIATCKDLKNSGWPITNNQKRWALGELTLGFEAVAPLNLR
jgi:hypothetical protein